MASPELETLLEVQEHDTVLDQLRHRKATIPERAQLAELEARADGLRGQLSEAKAARDEVVTQQEGLEAELAATEKRMKEIDQRLFSPTAGVRDMEAMNDELSSLKRRRSSLEDQVLEALEAREPLDAAVEKLEAGLATIAAEVEALGDVIAEAELVIEAEIDVEQAKRDAAATGVSDQLMQQYERLRSRLGGIGAARLVGTSCSGCHLTLPATEIDRIKKAPPDAFFTCDQCGRILVVS
ncbi:MAG TPA: C4-type zinc ribbon domain-containing protein [Acidimicrobiales bacterium]|nr:C4-type zinc ribbon domain-containing protein [Acidimicrobiales bacterium]